MCLAATAGLGELIKQLTKPTVLYNIFRLVEAFTPDPAILFLVLLQLIESLSAELGEVALPPAIMQDIVGGGSGGDKEGATGLTWL